MSTITLTCTRCGTCNFVPAAAMLAGIDADPFGPRSAMCVCWICSGCVEMVTERVDWRSLLTLLPAGVTLLAADLAPEDVDASSPDGSLRAERRAEDRLHPEDPPGGPAFTADDQLDLHQLLAGDTWFSEVLLSTDPGRS